MTTPSLSPPSRRFVSTGWLAAHLDDPNVIVLDGSFYLPAHGRDADAEYAAAHIPGAVRFDIDAVADHTSGLPHMLPTPDAFATAVGALGIGDGMTIVAYDGLGLLGAARVWWTFHVFGVESVFVLDGGMPQWLAEGRPVEGGRVSREARVFTPRFAAARVAALPDVAAALATQSAQLVDARPAARFTGEAAEPRAGMRSGHMPGACNVPASAVVQDGRLAPIEQLATAFSAGGVDLERPVITTCGSGVTAAVLWLALDALGKPPAALYDGSWSEWGGRADTAIVTGS